MTVIKNPYNTSFANMDLCRTGMPIRSSVLIGAQQTIQHLRNWRGGEFVAAYYGRPVESENGDPTNGTTSNYYVITGYPVREDSIDRKLGIVVGLHLQGFDDGGSPASPRTETWSWYKDKADGAATDTWTWTTPTTAAVPSIEDSAGPTRQFSVDVAPTASDDGFRASKLTSQYALVEGLGVFGVPSARTLDLDQAVIPVSAISPGEAIRGYDGAAGDSAGALVHYTDAGATDNATANSRRCLLQTCYPIGAWAENTTALTSIRKDAVSGLLGDQTYKVLPRDLGQGATADRDCDVAMVVTADSGVQIQLQAATSGQSWSYTSGGDTAALVTSSDGSGSGGATGLLVDPAGDYIKVTTKTGAGKDVLIHTVSLWEPLTIN